MWAGTGCLGLWVDWSRAGPATYSVAAALCTGVIQGLVCGITPHAPGTVSALGRSGAPGLLRSGSSASPDGAPGGSLLSSWFSPSSSPWRSARDGQGSDPHAHERLPLEGVLASLAVHAVGAGTASATSHRIVVRVCATCIIGGRPNRSGGGGLEHVPRGQSAGDRWWWEPAPPSSAEPWWTACPLRRPTRPSRRQNGTQPRTGVVEPAGLAALRAAPSLHWRAGQLSGAGRAGTSAGTGLSSRGHLGVHGRPRSWRSIRAYVGLVVGPHGGAAAHGLVVETT